MALRSFVNPRSSADTATATATFTPSALGAPSVRMRARIIGFLTAIGMAAVVFFGAAVPASAAPAECTVDDITYTVTSEDDATAAAASYSGAGGSVIICSTAAISGMTYEVTGIGVDAFRGNSLTSVTIPNSVTSISDGAFNSNSLESVTIPNSVTSIGGYAFQYNSLASVTIPNSVTSIGNSTFTFNLLESVTIPNSVTSIGRYAFNSNLLESVTIPNSVTSISEGAFSFNNLASVTIPNSVTSIGLEAFAVNKLASVTIPNSVTSIGEYAFGSNLLESVTIPNSVTSIGNRAFYNNSLESVTIPNSVSSIDGGAFDGNPVLASLTFAGPAPTLGGAAALGNDLVHVYYYAKYGVAAGATEGFTTPKWKEHPTSVLEETALTVSLDLDVTVGAPVADAPVEITAEGLLVGSAYTVVVRSTPTTIASGSATNTGTVSDSTGRMPSELAPGPHTVTFTGIDADGSAVSRVAYLTVSDTGKVTYLSYSAAESIVLAETGFDGAPLGAAAALLLLAAGVALRLRRRQVTA
jgi:hypothetical protein